MSASIQFRSGQPLSEATRRAIVAEMEHLEEVSPLLWYEPISFATDPSRPEHLGGWSKCPSLSIQTESGEVFRVSLEDWYFMNYWGMRMLVERLESWSQRYDLSWSLTCEDTSLGEIRNGKPDWRLRRELSRSSALARATGDESVDSGKVSELRKRYPMFG